jgi:aerobic-type carbon monoxide dehydrogenase small subunit (CoxS/CutS family)
MNPLPPDHRIHIRFRLNGVERTLNVTATARLLELLREQFGLMAAKPACRIGRCGACQVLFNGVAVNACLLMAWQIDGAEIVSAEALGNIAEGRAVRAAMVKEVAFQCGYCASGFIVALTALLRREPAADDAAIRSALAGNICRCTGYASILRGAATARALLAAGAPDPPAPTVQP